MNKWLETPLLIAANNGHIEGVKALLVSGADPSKCSEAGWSALTFAAHKGYDGIVSILLSSRAPVNCKVIEDSSTPLHKACAGSKHGHLESVRLLLENGANVHALNKWKETPLLTAANNGQTRAVQSLLEVRGVGNYILWGGSGRPGIRPEGSGIPLPPFPGAGCERNKGRQCVKIKSL